MRAIAAAFFAVALFAGGAWALDSYDEVVTLFPSTAITASQDGPVIGVGGVRHGSCLLDVTVISGTLDVYLQSIIAGTDDDYCRFTQASGVAKQVLSFATTVSTPATAAHAVSDRSSGVTAGQCRTGPLGKTAKLAFVVSGGGSATFSVICHLMGN